jgi:hypothetical protein
MRRRSLLIAVVGAAAVLAPCGTSSDLLSNWARSSFRSLLHSRLKPHVAVWTLDDKVAPLWLLTIGFGVGIW